MLASAFRLLSLPFAHQQVRLIQSHYCFLSGQVGILKVWLMMPCRCSSQSWVDKDTHPHAAVPLLLQYSLRGSFPTPWKTATYRLAGGKQTHQLSSRMLSTANPDDHKSSNRPVNENGRNIWYRKRPFNRRLKTTVSVILSLLRRTHCSRLSLTRTGRTRDKSKTSQPLRQASYDFKRAKFVLNVHTDVTDEEQNLNVLPIQAMMHYCFGAAASGLFASLHSVSFNNYWSSGPRSRSIQKAFTFNSTTICTTKPTAPNIQSKAIIIPLKHPHAWPPFV